MPAGSHGRLTAELAEELHSDLKPRGLGVFHDHGPEGSGRILCWYGTEGPSRKNLLSFIDIAVVDPHCHHNVLALVELEEKGDEPKKLLGDLFGTLLGDHVRFKEQVLHLGEWTTFIVMSKGSKGADGCGAYFSGKLTKIKPELGTLNSRIGEVIIRSAPSEAQLRTELRDEVESAIARGAVRQRFPDKGQSVEIPLQKGGCLRAHLAEGGIEVDNLGNQPFLPWQVFQQTLIFLVNKGGAAERGDAMNCKLGDPGLALDSVEGHIANVVYEKQQGESVFRRISAIAPIMVWAGLCENAPGKLMLKMDGIGREKP